MKSSVGERGYDMRIGKVYGMAILLLLFIAGGAGGYLYFSKVFPGDKETQEGRPESVTGPEDLFSLRMYYPVGGHLHLEERRLPRRIGQIGIAEATVEEYLRGPAGEPAKSHIPKEVRLLGVYKGVDNILYINFSDEFRRNFQGDVRTEFLLLKGLYESLISNVEEVQDVKVLIGGKEIETLGGHLYLLYPLKDMVSYEYQ
jgi:spore germination protein GerM